MFDRMNDMPEGLAGFTAGGTVIASDVQAGLTGLAPRSRVLTEIGTDFNGYLAELVGALADACREGRLARCALLVPGAMLPEARLHGGATGLQIFLPEERALAQSWAVD